MLRKKEKGFTLVEVIVVAVIVAVLAAVAIPLYIGYINDANKNAAENAAGSFASTLAACRNAMCNTQSTPPASLAAGGIWSANTPSGQLISFTSPLGVNITVTGSGSWGGGTVNATKGGFASINYSW